MEKNGWVKVTGTEYIILPLITKPDVESSNAFVIFTGSEFIIIDSSADKNRLSAIKSAILDFEQNENQLKILLTTHIHMDHCYSALNGEIFLEIPSLIWATHSIGADVIEAGDMKPTIGDLFNRTYKARNVDIHLFSKTEPLIGTDKSSYPFLQDKNKVTLCPGETDINLPETQYLFLQSGCKITLYHTPGHSPDSIVIQIGKDFFTGDILFATAPGVAGLHGFQKEDLIKSLISLINLVEMDLEGICYNGHGFAIKKPEFLKSLNYILKEARQMGEIGNFDLERLGKSKEHALDVISEADRLFAIIGGRLLAIEFDLENIGLVKEAEALSQLIEDEQIDLVLAEFHNFATGFANGENSEVRLVLKVVQILQKLKKIFSADSCSSYLDQSLITRSERLLADFLGTIRGFEDPSIESCSSLNAFINSFIISLSEMQVSDESLLLAAESEEEFNSLLLSRIAHTPLLNDIQILNDLQDKDCIVSADWSRLYDTLRGTFEECKAAGAHKVRIHAEREDNLFNLHLEFEPIKNKAISSEKKIQSFSRSFTRSGCKMKFKSNNEKFEIILSFIVCK